MRDLTWYVTYLDAITSLVSLILIPLQPKLKAFSNLNSTLAKTQGSLYIHSGKRLIRYYFIDQQVEIYLTGMYRPVHNKQG